MKRAFLVMTGLALALGGCDAAKQADAPGKASGQVLPGTISDAMIDLDRSQAQAPLAALPAVGGGAPNEAANALLGPGVAQDQGADGAPAAPGDLAAPEPAPGDASPSPSPGLAKKPEKVAEKPAAPKLAPAHKPAHKTTFPKPGDGADE
jgi:hypothetical protein